MAAPSYIAKGTFAESTTNSVAATYMGSINAGDIIYYMALNVQGTVGSIATASGFTSISEEVFSWGTIKFMYKVASGSESGTISLTRSGSTGVGTYFAAQLYQVRGDPTYLTIEEADPNSGTSSTITWDTVTVGGAERTLLAFVTNYDDVSAPGTPSGYTSSASDNSTLVSGMYLALKTKSSVSSDGSVTASGSANGWASLHVSIYNNIPFSRSFIVN